MKNKLPKMENQNNNFEKEAKFYLEENDWDYKKAFDEYNVDL